MAPTAGTTRPRCTTAEDCRIGRRPSRPRSGGPSPVGGSDQLPVGFQLSVPARYAWGVRVAASASANWGRLALTVAPPPVLAYSKNRPSVHRFGLMASHGWVILIAAGSAVLRMVT